MGFEVPVDFVARVNEYREFMNPGLRVDPIDDSFVQAQEGVFVLPIDSPRLIEEESQLKIPRYSHSRTSQVLYLAKGTFSYSRALCIAPGIKIPIRSHQEETNEVVVNLGDDAVDYLLPNNKSKPVNCEESFLSFGCNSDEGFNHGWKNDAIDSYALLYVAKALKPGYVDGNSFSVPKNTYNGR